MDFDRVQVTRRRLLALGVALAAAPQALKPRLARARARLGRPWGHGRRERGDEITLRVGRDSEGRFGLMFKHLDAFRPPEALLRELAQSMAEPLPPPARLDNEAIPSGFTYLGQFVVHDLTFDRSPILHQEVDPHGVENFDSPLLDLAVIYGHGPGGSPELYDPAVRGRLRLSRPHRFDDLPRRADGSALIGDPRNDENVILSQLHVVFIQFHNRLIDARLSFAAARRATTLHYQWLVVQDFLVRLAGANTVGRFLEARPQGGWKVKNEHYKPRNRNKPMMPLEFSLAAFRCGHSMVRPAYKLNASTTLPIFAPTPDGEDLGGGRPLPRELRIEWRHFFELPGAPANLARRIDPHLSDALFHLPVPGVVAPEPAPPIVSLAERNLLRGRMLGLPAGQDVARAMDVEVLENRQIGLDDRWEGRAPLWYYVLAEAAYAHDGRRLGPVGGRIVAEVLLGLLDADRDSVIHARDFTPAPPIARERGRFDAVDLLRFAGAA